MSKNQKHFSFTKTLSPNPLLGLWWSVPDAATALPLNHHYMLTLCSTPLLSLFLTLTPSILMPHPQCQNPTKYRENSDNIENDDGLNEWKWVDLGWMLSQPSLTPVYLVEWAVSHYQTLSPSVPADHTRLDSSAQMSDIYTDRQQSCGI